MTTLAPAAPLGGDPSLSPADAALYAMTVLVWGVSWYALKLQLGSVAPEVSVFWRFVLAAAIMMGWAMARRAPLRFSWRQHPRFAGLGLFIFSTNFTLFYYGGQHVPSGLLAVVFSLTSVVNLMLGYLFFRQTISRRVLVGGCLGVAGVALLFWPQISDVGGIDAGALAGLGLCLAGTLSFSLGSMVSASNQRAGISVVSASAWGMAYGALFLGLFAAVRGVSFAVPMTVAYLGSLVYLAIFASVIAFACYLTLIGRIGSARAGYATVLFPVVALMVSTALEGFVWGTAALLGLCFVLAGNILVLRSGRARV
ncbi:DMT family transporter [Stappia sp. ES.058]|uniref:DMT family transporter n=1 Tax=Stappia sp. ES.058 TaxID=1881061 RepID=UPI00087BEC87|nr:EamA family transporter [Stappia sp. ES.058]SDT90474.1 EamA-like transporter family protein [Stappia sp. ES.058]